MIQLGYYPQQHADEADFDPDYDPSAFLMNKKDSNNQEPMQQQQQPQQTYQQEQTYSYAGGIQEGAGGDEINMQQQYNYAYGTQQSFMGDYTFQSQSAQEEFSQTQQINDGGVLADLEISDSDDDDNDPNNTSENQGDGLWF